MITEKIKRSQFIPDSEAQWTGEKPNRRSLPTQFVPNYDDPALVRAADYLHCSDEALYKADRDRAVYWQSRAEAGINQFAKRTRRPLVKYDLPSWMNAHYGVESVPTDYALAI